MTFLGVLHAQTGTKNILWARRCLPVSVAIFLGGKHPSWPDVIVTQQWEPIVIVNPFVIVNPVDIANPVVIVNPVSYSNYQLFLLLLLSRPLPLPRCLLLVLCPQDLPSVALPLLLAFSVEDIPSPLLCQVRLSRPQDDLDFPRGVLQPLRLGHFRGLGFLEGTPRQCLQPNVYFKRGLFNLWGFTAQALLQDGFLVEA
jgi:hypothetical protein